MSAYDFWKTSEPEYEVTDDDRADAYAREVEVEETEPTKVDLDASPLQQAFVLIQRGWSEWAVGTWLVCRAPGEVLS